MPFNNKQDQTRIPFLLLLSATGLILYLIATNTFYFNDRLFSVLYYKSPSKAFDSFEESSQNYQKAEATKWQENWDKKDYLQDWDKLLYNCSSIIKNDTLNLNCQDAYLINKIKWNKDSSIIISGSFSVKGSAGIGLTAEESKDPYFQIITSPSTTSTGNNFVLENYQAGKLQEFKLVYTKIKDSQIVYYYIDDNPNPVKKSQINIDQNPSLFLSCQGSCSFGSITIAGIIKE